MFIKNTTMLLPLLINMWLASRLFWGKTQNGEEVLISVNQGTAFPVLEGLGIWLIAQFWGVTLEMDNLTVLDKSKSRLELRSSRTIHFALCYRQSTQHRAAEFELYRGPLKNYIFPLSCCLVCPNSPSHHYFPSVPYVNFMLYSYIIVSPISHRFKICSWLVSYFSQDLYLLTSVAEKC